MKFTTRELCQIGIFVVASAVLAQIAIPLPFTPVPVSFGLLAAFVSGIFLRPRCAVFAQVVYLTLGGMGLPVFGHFTGGLGILVGPTGGYLLAYPIMALIVAITVEGYEHNLAARFGTSRLPLLCLTFCALTAAMLVCYTLGTAWLMFLMQLPLSKALALAVYPFIPLDLFKVAFTALAILPLRERVLRMDLMHGRAKQGA